MHNRKIESRHLQKMSEKAVYAGFSEEELIELLIDLPEEANANKKNDSDSEIRSLNE